MWILALQEADDFPQYLPGHQELGKLPGGLLLQIVILQQ